MNWNFVALADVVPTPWRNGGGTTRELAVGLSAATADWQWRMSVAEVAASGPFSRFEGIDRWFAVLEGEGVQLAVQPQSHTPPQVHVQTPDSAPLLFDGAASTQCTLIDGPTQDFNLMVRRDARPSRMVVVSGRRDVYLDVPTVVAAYAINARATVHFEHEVIDIPAGTLAWTQVSSGQALGVSGSKVLWMEIPL
jgi:uncharacterized protein